MESNNATYDQVIILRFVILRCLWFHNWAEKHCVNLALDEHINVPIYKKILKNTTHPTPNEQILNAHQAL